MKVCFFFNYSLKREGFLKLVIFKEVLYVEKRKLFLNFCVIERYFVYSYFYVLYVYMVYFLEVIVYGFYQDKGYDYVQGNWVFKIK